MAGFMNAELVAIRDNLECGHCHKRFIGSDSQARKVKYEKATVYCSSPCREAAAARRRMDAAANKPAVGLSGPCLHCGKMFRSRTAKKYCTLQCYTASAQFRSMVEGMAGRPLSADERERAAAKLRKGRTVQCPECSREFYQKAATKSRPAKTFCSRVCYRSHFAKRFDKWVANPEAIALPQCYDEFLDQDEIRCLVDGCSWKGKHLSIHINSAHGVPADEFKAIAGFNRTTGVIARPLAEAFSGRELAGVAAGLSDDSVAKNLDKANAALNKNPELRKRSLEAIEHGKKARTLSGLFSAPPTRVCQCCGKEFQQSTVYGRKKYCTVQCRSKSYSERRKGNQRRMAGNENQ